MSEDREAQFVVESEKEEIEQILEKLKSGYIRVFKGSSSAAEKEFECKCSKKHESLKQLQKHILEDHREVRTYNRKHCTICPKTFRDIRDLTRHVDYVHNKIKNHECPICKKKFAFAQLTDRHRKQVHEKIKNHKCHICDKKFPQAQNLSWHIRGVHERLKPYKCQTCGNNFSQSSSLSNHNKNIHQKKEKIDGH